MPQNLDKNLENSENTHPLKTLNKQLKNQLSILKKEQQEIDVENVKMKARIQQLLVKRNELLRQKKEDDEERKNSRK